MPLAVAFAQFIVCEKAGINKAASGGGSLFDEPLEAKETTLTDACGICSACVKAGQLIHPDIHFSYPVITQKAGDKPLSTDYIVQWREFFSRNPYGNSFDWLQHLGADNKQGNITAHECNDITRKMSLKSFEGDYKVLVMWMPELLGKEGNKLLKLIEEPPPGTVFLFVAENEALILPTILSRLQLVKLPQLRSVEIEAALEMRENVSIAKAEQIAAIAEGNYHEALQQLQHGEDDWDAMLREWLNSMVKLNAGAQVKWIEEIAKTGREKQKQFLKYFTHLLRQSLRIQASGMASAETGSQPAAVLDFAKRFNKLADAAQIGALIEELDKTAYYIERNANAKIQFHALTIRVIHILRDKEVILVN